MTTATELFTPSDHAQWADDTALRATATSWCQQLWCYLGRPISVERVAAAARADGRSEARVTLRIVGTDRTTWNTHEAGAVDEDPGVATASAVFAAVSQADPITVPLWNLDTLGHIVAATALDDGHERPNIGPEAEVELTSAPARGPQARQPLSGSEPAMAPTGPSTAPAASSLLRSSIVLRRWLRWTSGFRLCLVLPFLSPPTLPGVRNERSGDRGSPR